MNYIGEFNGWKGEELGPLDVGVAFIIKKLSAGRYRYKYVIDGIEHLDPGASTIMAENGSTDNIIIVLNPPLYVTAAQTSHNQLKLIDQVEVPQSIIRRHKPMRSFPSPDEILPSRLRLETGAPLEHIRLRNYRLGNQGIWALSAMIHSNIPSIRSFDISYNNITDDGLLSLVPVLSSLPCLECLFLQGNGFRWTSISRLCQAVRYTSMINIHSVL